VSNWYQRFVLFQVEYLHIYIGKIHPKRFVNNYYVVNLIKYRNESLLAVILEGLSGRDRMVVGLPNNSYTPITNTAWIRARLCKLQKWCTRLAATSDKVYQLLELPMVGGSLQVHHLLPPLKLVAMIKCSCFMPNGQPIWPP
jgi:hypothetical protein